MMMHRHARSEAGDLPSPRSSRAASFSSERATVAGSVTFQMPTSARPPPAYIAASVASQMVTDHHNAQLRDDGAHDGGAPDLITNAVFSEQALSLLNGFLDNLLFAFLSTARSPTLAAIRPAITEVLKPRLAREATATADDELQGLLGGDEEEELPEHVGSGGAAGDKWDVEKVWKRTRLRIMVYTRLGELEDGDEQRYVQQEQGLSMDDSGDDEAGLVSWASAIFLTSVIEYVAEQTLLVSGQASYARMAARLKKAANTSGEGAGHQLERIVVEDFDVEKIALNSALGRLWRTWRKRVRSPLTPLSPAGAGGPRAMASFSSLHSRKFSYETDSIAMGTEGVPELAEHQPSETDIAANIPLPISDNDVEEIEVPGLTRAPEDEAEDESGAQTPVSRPQRRPSSVIVLASAENFKRKMGKERPVSLPPPQAQPLTVPAHGYADEDAHGDALEAVESEEVFATPMERVESDESYIVDEEQEDARQVQDEGEVESDADMVAFAASTGMGFGMGPASPTKSGGFAKEDEDTVGTLPENKTGYAEPLVLQSKRLSFEKPGPPGVVRTYSTRSQRSSPMPTPEAKSSPFPTPEAKSYLDDHSDDDVDSEAIGVARTSNVPIPTPSPPGETRASQQSPSYVQAKEPDHQGFVELAPRNVTNAPSTPPARDPSPAERTAQRERHSGRKVITPENGVQRRAATPPKGRGPPLAALQEMDSREDGADEETTPKKPSLEPRRSTPTSGSPRNHASTRARDSPVPVADRSVKRPAADASPLARSGTNGSAVEKATLKRVSSSSTARSVSTSILNTGLDSDSVAGSTRPRGLSRRMSEDDRVREFDTLVKSEDTVKFTLTPQGMRDIDEPPVRKVDQTRPRASSVTVYPPVSADKDNQFGTQPLPPRTTSRNSSHTASPKGHTPTRSAGRKPLAREPRIQSESMRDFADFIRSTGPAPGEERPLQPFVALSHSVTQSPNGSSTAVSGLNRKISTKQTTSHSKSSSINGEGPSARPRVHMRPRSPAGPRSGNDDLIDFIRQGPPDQKDGTHRIPRAVAPFRTTVDSDQFDRMLDENGNIESAYGSQVSTTSKQSANSRTGLLPAPTTVQPAYSNTPQKLTGSLSSGPEPQVTRTRRRVKDPYAIDLSDEEDEDLVTALPKPQITRTRRRIKDPYAIDLSDEEDEDLLTALPRSGRRQEESLMDFLNSTEPPPSNNPQPLLLNGATVAAAKARASGPSSSSSTAAKNGTNPAFPKVIPSASPGGVPSIIPSTAPPPRSNKPRLQARGAGAREAQVGRSATDDLADFLRTSGPPPEMERAPPVKEQPKRSTTRFWRKRASADVA